jgi:hypothetical protein
MPTPEELYQSAGPYLELYQKASQEYGIPLEYLLAQGAQESGFRPNVSSPAGAQGIAQFMPGTAKDYGINPLDPAQAIPAQAQYYKKGLDMYGGDHDKALAAYNAGFGAVNKYNGVPPYKETQGYVSSIKNMAPAFKELLIKNGVSPSEIEQIAQSPLTPAEVSSDAGVGKAVAAEGEPKKKGNFLNNLTTVLAGLSGAGGLFANTVAAFKGGGSPGDSAIKQSQGLLEVLRERQNKQEAMDEFSLYAERANVDPGTKATARALAKAGKIDDAIKYIGAPGAAAAKSAAELKQKQIEATDPILAKVKRDEKTADEERGYKLFKSKEDYQQKLRLELEKAKAEKKEVSPAAKARQDRIIDKINTELGSVPVINEAFDSIEAALKKAPSGRVKGNFGELKNMVTGENTAYKEYETSLNAVLGSISTAFGNKGSQSDKDVAFIKTAIPKFGDTAAEQKASMQKLRNFVANKVAAYKKATLAKPDAAEFGELIDTFAGRYPVSEPGAPAAATTGGGINQDLLNKYGGKVVSE